MPGPMGRCAFTHIIRLLECSWEIWTTQRAFLYHQEGAGGCHEGSALVSAETLKACALIGLHLSAAEGETVSSEGCPKSPEWISSCSASETSLGCEVYEHNNECRAIDVIGQDWSSEVVDALCRGLVAQEETSNRHQCLSD